MDMIPHNFRKIVEIIKLLRFPLQVLLKDVNF